MFTYVHRRLDRPAAMLVALPATLGLTSLVAGRDEAVRAPVWS